MDILDRLAKSKFRSKFRLKTKELEYIEDKGLDTIRSHACDFIRDRIAPAGLLTMVNKPQYGDTLFLLPNTQLPPAVAVA